MPHAAIAIVALLSLFTLAPAELFAEEKTTEATQKRYAKEDIISWKDRIEIMFSEDLKTATTDIALLKKPSSAVPLRLQFVSDRNLTVKSISGTGYGAGMKAGDILIGVDANPVTSVSEISRFVRSFEEKGIGATVRLIVKRGNDEITLETKRILFRKAVPDEAEKIEAMITNAREHITKFRADAENFVARLKDNETVGENNPHFSSLRDQAEKINETLMSISDSTNAAFAKGRKLAKEKK